MDANDNELAYLEAIHLFVEILGLLSRVKCILQLILNLCRFLLRQCMRVGSRFQLLQGWRVSFCVTLQNYNSYHQVYAILDEIFLAGEIEETSKDVVLARLEELEKLE